MKILNGADLADFIKERQARQVRALRQASHIYPKLAIVQTSDDPVIDSYVSLKRRYAADVLIDVEHYKIAQAELLTTIDRLNGDETVHGIIIQLPLANSDDTQVAVDAVAGSKDVDGLGSAAQFDPATPVAIDWLVNGYNVDVKQKKIAIVGAGRLVGAPLAKLWRGAGYDVTVFDNSSDITELNKYELIVSATGTPGLITSQLVQPGAVVVDAGTASEHGKIVGDVADDVRERDDVTITPQKGGVGPLTIAALFDNVIRAAQRVATAKEA
jgi:methylenetetrahydrofolate dehydrogenase (NADP+)/methenyltetrahydrofolate cyclohydrolase